LREPSWGDLGRVTSDGLFSASNSNAGLYHRTGEQVEWRIPRNIDVPKVEALIDEYAKRMIDYLSAASSDSDGKMVAILGGS